MLKNKNNFFLLPDFSSNSSSSVSSSKGVNPDRKSGAVPLRRLGGELHRLSGSTYG